MKKKTKWICALLTSAVTLCCAATVAACTNDLNSSSESGSNSGSPSSSNTPSGGSGSSGNGGGNGNQTDTSVTEGAETGVYYFDADGKEYLLSLYGGNSFTLNKDDSVSYGTYTVTDGAVTFTWAKDSNDTLSATYANGALTVVYNGDTMVYLRKKSFTVNFDANGGSAVAAATVTNGKTLTQPADPVKEGYTFVGWYTDSNYTTPFLFGTRAVTEDITLYAQWVKKTPGQSVFTVTLDENYAGASTQTVQTVDGKLYNLPTPEREGYTFAGWWISQYNDPEKLSYQYTSDTTFAEDTTLYAVWTQKTTGSKLASPTLEVSNTGLVWDSVSGATAYRVVISLDGEVVKEETVSANRYAYAFEDQAAGDYIVSVTAVAASSSNNSDAAVVYYKNKSLARVSRFTVIDGNILLFEGVANAERYYITVECGTEGHTHELFDNGSSTTFNFANCAMQEGGIKFTVTATANGYVSSESATYTYNRTLSAVQDLTFDESSQLLSWDAVDGATEYIVSIGNGEDEYITESVGNKTYYSLKKYTGTIVINVYPKTKGYNSPVATTLTVNKTILATPDNVEVSGKTITWDAVEGATGYAVKIGGTTVTTTTNSYDATSVLTEEGKEYTFTVQALGSQNSAWSDGVTIRYAALASASYSNGVLSWDLVAGAESYQVKVNNGTEVTVIGKNYTDITLTQSGANTLSVRFYDGKKYSAWTEVTVYAHTIYFDARNGEEVAPVYRATGDKLNLPETTRSGYNFGGWYTTPGGAANNAAQYTNSQVFDQTGDIVIYANWNAKEYTVTLDGLNGEEATTTIVKFGSLPSLGTVTNSDGTKVFGGWYTEAEGGGDQCTDIEGNALNAWNISDDVTLYAKWYTAFIFTELTNGTYSVKKGADIDKFTKITVPSSYQGKAVTVLEGYAFRTTTLTEINIPDTITIVESTAFYSCKSLVNVNVYTTGDMLEEDIVYRSTDGVLAVYASDESAWEIAFYPLGKTDAYVIPDYIGVIPLKAFSGTNLTSVTIPYSVFRVGANAFYNCQKLTEVIFSATPAGETAQDLTIDASAFYACRKLTDVTLPARLTEFDSTIFDSCTTLERISVEKGGTHYTSMDGYLCSADGVTLVYSPKGRSGEITIPTGIKAIGDGAFTSCTKITSLTIPFYVTSIGESAFNKCTLLRTVKIEGGTLGSLVIGASAFSGCTLTTLDIAADANLTEIGDNALQKLSISELTLPASLTRVGVGAFANSSLKKVVFTSGGKGELTLETQAFSNCVSLTDVTLPDTLTVLGANVFEDCAALKNLTIDANNRRYKTMEDVVYSYDMTSIVYCAPSKKGAYTVPSTVTTIGDYTFADCAELTSIFIPKSVTHIGKYAFENCVSLTTVSFSSSDGDELEIDEYAFSGAVSLTSIILPDRVTAIADYAFYNDAKLQSISFKNVTSIGVSAFEGASNLTSINLTGITSLGDAAFKNTGLTSVTIPETITRIGKYVLSGSNITIATVRGNQTIGAGAFANCIYLTTLNIGEGVTDLPANMCDGCYQLESVTIPSTVVSIGNYAFNDCRSLKLVDYTAGGEEGLSIGDYAFQNWGTGITDGVRLNLPSRLSSIGAYAFSAANIVGKVYIPKNVKELGVYVFNKCTGITSVEFEDGDIPLTISEHFMYSCSALKTVTLSSRIEALSKYSFNVCAALESINIPKGVKSIDPNAFYASNKDLILTVEDGNEYYKLSQGVLYELSEGKPVSIIYANSTMDSKITIPNTVTNITGYTFQNKTALEEIEFESGRTEKLTIGTYAFNGCSSLKSVNLPVLAALGSYAFYKNTSLTNLTFEEGTASDSLTLSTSYSAADAFAYSGITSVHLPAYFTATGTAMFTYCTDLATITFAENSKLTTLGSSTFNKSAITEITLPDSITTMSTSCLGYCTNLTKVVLPKSLKSGLTGTNILGYFTGSTSLKELSIDSAATNYTVKDNIIYNKTGKTLLWAPYGLTGEVTVASGTTTIGDKSFYQNNSVTKVTIPSSVTAINTYAFGSTTALETVVFDAGTSTMTVGTYAFNKSSIQYITIPARANLSSATDVFDNCKSLTTVVFEGTSKTTSLPNKAFYQATALTSVVLPQGMTLIGLQAFQETALTEITIPKTVTKFGSSTSASTTATTTTGSFYKCNSLTKVIFEEGSKLANTAGAFSGAYGLTTVENWPSTITELGNYTFYGCTSLSDISFLKNITKVGNYAFNGCTALTDIDALESLTTTGTYVFTNCTFSAIHIPATMVTIGDSTFSGCKSLTEVVIPEGVTSLGTYVFNGATALESITLPSTLVTIGKNAFQNTAITSIVIPESVVVTSTSTYFFYGCKALKEVTFENELDLIPNYMFNACEALKTVNYKGTLTSIGSSAFSGCSALESFNMGNSVTTISASAFYGCTSLKDCPISTAVETIGTSAFYNCSNLEVEAELFSLQSIGNTAFYGCSSLKSIETVDTLTSLGNYAFQDCTSLEGFYIPASLTSIGTNPFLGCTAMKTIDMNENNTSFVVIDNILYNTERSTILVVPAALEGNIAIPETVTSIATAAFKGSAISGVEFEGRMTAISDSAFAECTQLTSITLPSGLSTIGANAFDGCTSLAISLVLPRTVTLVGNYAFRNCPITQLTFEEGGTDLVRLGDYAFQNADLTTLYVPLRLRTSITSKVYAIGSHAFEGNSKLASITYEEGIDPASSVFTIGSYAFAECTSLKELAFTTALKNAKYTYTEYDGGANITASAWLGAIGSYAFYKCTSLEKVSFAADATRSIGSNGEDKVALSDYAFAECTALKDITFPEYIEFYTRSSTGSAITGAKGLFSNCTSLETIELPDPSAYTIYVSTSMFAGCTSLKEVTGGKFATIGQSAFEGCTSLVSITTSLNITSIGASAFKDCAAFTTLNAAGFIVGSVGVSAFEGCTSLKSFALVTTTATTQTTINNYAFKGCTALTELTGYRFYTIGQSAFEGCTALAKFEFKAAAAAKSTIGVDAFKGCTALTSVSFYGSQLTINQGAFSGWTADQTITFLDYTAKPDTFTEGWNENCAANIIYAGVESDESEE
jgi:uncharacterized repeat protein (TIGR02543 family)